MHTISVNLYTFDELSREAQHTVINRERFINVDDSFWYEPVIEDWTEELEHRGFEQVKILFSGFGSQGDGACFEARINIASYLRAHNRAETYPLLTRYPDRPAVCPAAGGLGEEISLQTLLPDLAGAERKLHLRAGYGRARDVLQHSKSQNIYAGVE